MAEKDKKLVKEITHRDEDFAQWYTDIVKKADLTDYSAVKGFMIIRPYGYAIWENIQKELDSRFKETGHENIYMPLLIPESLLQKEKDHVDGFAPEVAWVTQGGSDVLNEKLCIRPTSETLFCDHYSNIIQSYRDLPKLYNQWCSVVRWEKTTRPFLRTREFLWQEGHTAHASAEDAQKETLRMLDVYADFCEEILAMPVLKGLKTNKEKFAGARSTYTIESLMHDGKALQSGTSHNFGDGFAKAFNIQFADAENKLTYVHQTSWGVSTRLIGGLIMVHSDDDGLVLPPNIAPIQVVIIPIAMHKGGVKEKAVQIRDELKAAGIRVALDDSDKMPGWKFAEYEMKGIPLRIEIGPRDIEKDQCVMVTRNNREKIFSNIGQIRENVTEKLKDIQKSMYENALKLREEKTYTAADFDTFKKIIEETPGFVKAMWCGNESCEDKIKELTGATARCIPFTDEKVGDTCVCCGEKAEKLIYFAKAY